MREEDALDAMIERMAREEQDDADRQHGQFLLDLAAAQEGRRRKDPLLELLEKAHQGNLKPDDAT